MNIISHKSNYYGIKDKIASLPHVHSGSWFGLPDFGITEAIGGAFGAPKTSQGGSDIFKNPQKASTGVLGTSTPSYSAGSPNLFSSGTPYQSTPTAPSGGGSGSNNTSSLRDQMLSGQIPWDDNLLAQANYDADAARREQEARSAINSGYDSYFNSLNSILNETLPGQRTAQEQIVGSQFNQGVDRLGFQKTQGLNDLAAEETKTQSAQSKTLKDISENIRNSFNAGNVYLGARGAGDSSAANQYSYALTKLGSQQRGDINSQFQGIYGDINSRMTKLGDVYNQAVNDLSYERDQKVSGIAQWFGEQQNALKMAQANGELQKGQDLATLSQNLLNVALQNLQNVQSEVSNRRSALEEWAMSNSQNIQQLQGNMGAIASAPFAQAPKAQSIVGTPQTTASGGLFAPTGFGGSSNETDIFGRPLRA
jgi:hypothetical protein